MSVQKTSLEAYEEIKSTLGDRQTQVLKLLESIDRPLTNSEIAQQLGWSINRITPRVFELREKGLVEEDKKKPCPITGRNALTWRIVKPKKPIQGTLWDMETNLF